MPRGARERASAETRVTFRDLLLSLRDLRFRHVTVLTAVLGLAGWCFYLWRTLGLTPGSWTRGVITRRSPA